MDLSQLSINQLEKVISKKNKWLNKIIDFLQEVVREHGKKVDYRQGSSHTYIKYELHNVRGFSFMTEGSFTMYGGDGVKIWYQSSPQVPKQEVLHLEWWNPKEIYVRVSIDEKKWVGAFKKLMKDKKKIFPTPDQKEKQKKQDEKKVQDQRFEHVRRAELLEKAQKMGLR